MKGIENMLKSKRILTIGMLLLISILLSFAMVACGSQQTEEPEPLNEYKVIAYFVNNEYIETGDESVGVLVEYDGFNVYCKEGEQYANAITMLWQVPEDIKNSGQNTSGSAAKGENLKLDTVVTEKYGIRGCVKEDKTLFVDLVGKDLRGGSLEETLFISQIVETILASFPEIEGVKFLVDGEEAESLMGHCDASIRYEEGIFKAQ